MVTALPLCYTHYHTRETTDNRRRREYNTYKSECPAASIRFANGRIVPSLPKYMMYPVIGLDWRSDSANILYIFVDRGNFC